MEGDPRGHAVNLDPQTLQIVVGNLRPPSGHFCMKIQWTTYREVWQERGMAREGCGKGGAWQGRGMTTHCI